MDRPSGFQEDEAPRFQDNRHMKVVSLSAQRTGRRYPPGNFPGTDLDKNKGNDVLSVRDMRVSLYHDASVTTCTEN